MRTRTIMTVALLSAAGCGTSGSARQSPASKPEVAATSTTIAASPALTPVTSTPAVTTVMVAPAPPVPLDGDGPVQLERLADELRATITPRPDQLVHFRPLCDAQGYPLVGNLMTKSAHQHPGEVTSFCASVRTPAAP